MTTRPLIPVYVTKSEERELLNAIFKNSLEERAARAFFVEHKNNLREMIGETVSNKVEAQGLIDEGYTHFTPNVYRIDKDVKGKIYGHKYANLHAINVIVLDFDVPGIIQDAYTILDHCEAKGVPAPTYVVKTDKKDAYQIGYVLDQSLMMPAIDKNRTEIINQIKFIHDSFKEAFVELEPDKACLAIGFYRTPRLANIKVYTRKFYNLRDLFEWANSKRQQLEVIVNDHPAVVLENESYDKYDKAVISKYNLNAEWFQRLINCRDVRGGLRNTAVFTMALALKQGKILVEDAMQELVDWNNRLANPLAVEEVIKAVTSAYTRHYVGPGARYIRLIMEEVFGNKDYKVYSRIFTKHKKDRQDRVYSHWWEREADLQEFLIKRFAEGLMDERGYLKITTRQLIEDSGIPKTALFKLLKHSENIIYTAHGKGRGSYILISCIDVLADVLTKDINNMDIVSSDYVRGLTSYPKPLQDILFNELELKGVKVSSILNLHIKKSEDHG